MLALHQQDGRVLYVVLHLQHCLYQYTVAKMKLKVRLSLQFELLDKLMLDVST